ncbi:hypothetical protein BV20DRAFT_462439 [Pilatotrama ljubarskyi]|nr:hypothetical protein BV20DRAFT_462439 [Pilatotrama ljubarskyi]
MNVFSNMAFTPSSLDTADGLGSENVQVEGCCARRNVLSIKCLPHPYWSWPGLGAISNARLRLDLIFVGDLPVRDILLREAKTGSQSDVEAVQPKAFLSTQESMVSPVDWGTIVLNVCSATHASGSESFHAGEPRDFLPIHEYFVGFEMRAHLKPVLCVSQSLGASRTPSRGPGSQIRRLASWRAWLQKMTSKFPLREKGGIWLNERRGCVASSFPRNSPGHASSRRMVRTATL